MNFAEFPLAAIADRVPDDQKTLVFEDQIFDSGRSEMITRRLTITASEKFGLPTSLDDEVILGLIQLSKKSRFSDRKVNFSRYQLIQELGWRHEGRSYERLEKSLKRWLTVTLDYEKAWWDKEAQSWVDESFHILDNLTLYDQERRLRQLRSSSTDAALSSFMWNEVIFRSFKSGNLRTIDMRVFRQLEFAAAKRMYRFLDKRFYHKSRWEFDLTEFACEHIGVSRNYDTGQLKRRLQPAIEELEAVGFLEALPVGAAVCKDLSRRVADCLYPKSRSANRAAESRRGPAHQATRRARRDAVGRNGTGPRLSARADRNADGGSRSLAASEGTRIHPQPGRVSGEVDSRRLLAASESFSKANGSQVQSAPRSRKSPPQPDPVQEQVNAYLLVAQQARN